MIQNKLRDKLGKIKLLYVEDEDAIRSQISEFLGRYVGFLINVSSAEEAMVQYKKHAPDMLLLDVNLPGKNGLTLAEEIRVKDRNVRIIVSTAYTDKDFLLQAVELELTRYLVKPVISSDLLEALEKAVVEIDRRKGQKNSIDLSFGYTYERDRKIVMYAGEMIRLRRKEAELLEYLIDHSDQTVSYERLEYGVWKDTPMSKDAIRAQIRNIRKKIHPDVIKNVTAIGYMFSQKASR
ncbi:response regulator transcription factor [Sulfurovum sp.]|uniref:response regulator transcription factor n=1 Tax=Sulfurovum sp. TaxID=1969726 RepID=UPI0025D320F5|nr:response regulator transcription factor [Sulfurovum sp.]